MSELKVRCLVCKKPLSDENYVMLQIGPKCLEKYTARPKMFESNNTAVSNFDITPTRIRINPRTLELAKNGELVKEYKKDPDSFEKHYLNERKSKVNSIGEDIPGLARHRNASYKMLLEAEDLGIHEDLIKRDKLIKLFRDEGSLKNIEELCIDDPEKMIFLSNFLKRFPPDPLSDMDYRLDRAIEEYENTGADPLIACIEKMNDGSERLKILVGDHVDADKIPLKVSEVKSYFINNYFDAFNEHIKLLEDCLDETKDKSLDSFITTHRNKLSFICDTGLSDRQKISELLTKDKFDERDTYFINRMYKRFNRNWDLGNLEGTKSKEFLESINSFLDLEKCNKNKNNFLAKAFNATHASNAKNASIYGIKRKLRELKEKFPEKAQGEEFKNIALSFYSSKKSLDKCFGEVTKRKVNRFNRASLYEAQLEIKNSKYNQSSLKDLQKVLSTDKKSEGCVGFKSVIFGKSVSDEERLNHLKNLTNSLEDLSFAIGSKMSDLSLNNTLAVGIGANGKGNALAHYQSGEKFINLTRKKGHGSLAHEWAHALDHHLSQELQGRRVGFLSTGSLSLINDNRSSLQSQIKRAEKKGGSSLDLLKREYRNKDIAMNFKSFKEALVPFVARMKSSDSYRGLTPKRREYFESHQEVFARVFEKMIDYKLSKSERKNTYLSSAHHKDYYPNDDELKEIEPLFDKLMGSVFGKEKKKKKSA